MPLNKIIDKLKNKHFMSLAGNGSMQVMAMVLVAIMYRWLSKADMGNYVFFTTVFVLIDTFRTGFLQTALIKFYAGTDEKRAAEVLGSVWYLGTLITFGLIGLNVIGFVFIRSVTNPQLIEIIQWFGISFLVTLPSSIASWIMSADQRFDKLLILNVTGQGTFIIAILTLVFLNQMTLTNVLLANLLSSFITSVICFICGWTSIAKIRFKTRQCAAELYHFGKYSVGTTLSTNLLRGSDTFIITFMLGPAALAIYTIPGRLLNIVEIPLRSFLATGMSAMSAHFNKNKPEDVAYTMQKYAGMVTLVLMPVCFGGILLAGVATGLLGGGKYVGTEAANLLRIFMFLAMFFTIDRFLGVTLDIVNQPKYNFYKVLLMLGGNIIGDFLGIYIFKNIYGVAIATAVPVVIGIGYGYYCLRKHLNITLAGIFKIGFNELKLLLEPILKFSTKKNAAPQL